MFLPLKKFAKISLAVKEERMVRTCKTGNVHFAIFAKPLQDLP